MSLSCLRRDYPGVPLMALTATANQKVVEDAIRVLGMKDAFLYRSSFNRPNLAYEVRKKDGKTIDVMAEYVASRRHESGVIYCLSRKDCETVCDKLQAKLREKNCGNVGVSFYHAELDPFDRKQRHHAWSTGKISVLCATIAFGMGECNFFYVYIIDFWVIECKPNHIFTLIALLLFPSHVLFRTFYPIYFLHELSRHR